MSFHVPQCGWTFVENHNVVSTVAKYLADEVAERDFVIYDHNRTQTTGCSQRFLGSHPVHRFCNGQMYVKRRPLTDGGFERDMTVVFVNEVVDQP